MGKNDKTSNEPNTSTIDEVTPISNVKFSEHICKPEINELKNCENINGLLKLNETHDQIMGKFEEEFQILPIEIEQYPPSIYIISIILQKQLKI